MPDAVLVQIQLRFRVICRRRWKTGGATLGKKGRVMTPGSREAAINFIFSVSLTVFIYSNYFAAFIFLQASLRSSGLKHCCGYEKKRLTVKTYVRACAALISYNIQIINRFFT